MPESISSRIAKLIRANYRPGDAFTSRQIGDALEPPASSGAVTGFLYKIEKSGAVRADDVCIVNGLRVKRYRVIDLDRMRVHTYPSAGGKRNRPLSFQPRPDLPVYEGDVPPPPVRNAEPDPVAPEAVPTASRGIAPLIERSVSDLRAAIELEIERANLEVERVRADPDLSRVSTDRLLEELRGRVPR